MGLRIMLVWLGLRFMFLCIYVLVGWLCVALARPLMTRAVAPNYAYGFRVAKTLNDPQVWYDANEYCGRCLHRFGVTLSVCGIVLFFIPAIDFVAYGLTLGVATLVGSVGCAVLGDRYVDKITKPKRVQAGDERLE